jgi:hypothetical protein
LIARAVALVVVLAVGAPASASAAPRNHRLRHVHSFAFAIGDGTLSGDYRARLGRYDLVVGATAWTATPSSASTTPTPRGVPTGG